MQIRLFVDEDAMAHALVTGLRARGIDVLTVGEGARRRLDDDEQLEFATSQGRVLYTFNTDSQRRIPKPMVMVRLHGRFCISSPSVLRPIILPISSSVNPSAINSSVI